MVSLPAFNPGQGTQQGFLSSTPLINPQANQPMGATQLGSSPFPSSASSFSLQAPGLNISTLGQTGTGTPSTRPQGLSLGLSAPSTQGFGLGSTGIQPQGLGLGSTGTQPQGLGLGSTGTQPQGLGLGSTGTQSQSLGLGSTGIQPQGLGLGSTGTYPQGLVLGSTGIQPQGLGLGSTGIQPQGLGLRSTGTHPQGLVLGNTGTYPQGLVLGSTGIQPQGLGLGSTGTHPQGLGLGNTGTYPQGLVLGSTGTQPQGLGLGSTGTQPQGLGLGSTGTQPQGLGGLGNLSKPTQLGATSTQSTLGAQSGLLGQLQPSSLGAITGQTLGLGATPSNQGAGLNIGGGTGQGLGISKTIPQPQTFNLSVSTAKPLLPTLGTAPAPTTQVQVLTLGGAIPQSGANTAPQPPALPNDVKDMDIDQGLDQLVKNLSAHVKQQKGIQDELSKTEMRSLQTCEKDHKALARSLAEWKRGVSEYSGQVSSLKEDSLQDIRVAEVAQRTHELPASLQGEHNDPKLYFQMLVGQFSEKLSQYQQVVEELTKNFSQMDSQAKTPQEVSETFKLLNDNFISLAATIYSLHTRVAQLKDNVVAYSSIYSKETQLHFPKRIPAVSSSASSGELKSGPTPFSLSGASLLTQKYSLGGFGTDLHLQTSTNPLNTLQSNLSRNVPTFSLGNKSQDLNYSSHPITPSKFTSFLSQSQTPQKATPHLNLSLTPQSANPTHLAPAATAPIQYPQGFSKERRGSISGESEEHKKRK